MTIHEAKAKLEADGLHVSFNNDHSLWIAATVRDAGRGIRMSDDASALIGDSGRWTAVFPAEGMLTYEVPGALPDLVSLIGSVYAQYRRAGGQLKDAFPKVRSEPEQYLIGHSPARV